MRWRWASSAVVVSAAALLTAHGLAEDPEVTPPASAAAAAVSATDATPSATPTRAEGGSPRARQIAEAIAGLELDRAERLLEGGEQGSLALRFERARLALHRADCERAAELLGAPALAESKEASSLLGFARGCAGATVAGLVVEDAEAGVWLRLQDASDRPLVPYLVAVAQRARAASARDLGVELPRPLRIELVSDLFSLSAVTGLPLSAAETTGTVAVARWGKITMLSPRATPQGYPWEDTLAHEISHLVLTAATRDRASLWLQEGLAKRSELRWREERPFDEPGDADETARAAAKTGRSVGVEKLGPSIAMLPSPDAARVAYAEVTSFVGYFIERHGEGALQLLILDLRGGAETDAAMRSVTGHPVAHWVAQWQQWVAQLPEPTPMRPSPRVARGSSVANARWGELLLARGHAAAAARSLEQALLAAPESASLRARAARALEVAGEPARADGALGALEQLTHPSGAWFALDARRAQRAAQPALAAGRRALGLAYDPLEEGVACDGQWVADSPPAPPPLPSEPRLRALCEAARAHTSPAP